MARKLRIAAWYNLPSGGAKRALHDQLQGLKDRGHEIVVWRPPVGQLDYLPIAEIVEEREIPLEIKTPIRLGKLSNVTDLLSRRNALREGMRRHSEAVAKEINSGGFDVLFASNCREFHAPWVARYVDLPKAIYLGEPIRPLYEATLPLPWPALPEFEGQGQTMRQKAKDLYLKVKDEFDVHALRRLAADELRNAKSFDRILVNSNFSRESVLRAYGLNSTVCYLGIDASRFENRGMEREPFVISVGIFHVSKNPEFIVRAIGSIPENRPRLVWVANKVFEDERDRIQKLAEELGVVLDIRQYIPDAEMLDLLGRASVMAYAPRLEPFGYAPLEANACGLPAVVVAEGGVKESVVSGINGVVVPYRPEAMGSAIADLLADPIAARTMGERAATHVRKEWSLERAAEALERNLLEVADKL